MTDELNPVPCGCGGEASVDYFIGEPSEGASYAVYCRKCEIHTMSYDTEAEAITAWNTAMGMNTRRLLEVLVHDAEERTAKEKMTMSECMQFPDTWEEFEQAYGFEDKKEIYTNGSRLIQSFRVKQWLDHIAEPERTAKVTKRFMLATGGMGDTLPVCECGFIVSDKWQYCPHCGARLEWNE